MGCPYICTKSKNENCEFQEEEKFCVKKYKLDSLYGQACLSDAQKKKVDLRIDSSGADREEFLRLKEIQENIEKFVEDGNNLYIYSEICGNGKTEWSVRLLQQYFSNIYWKCSMDCHGLFVNVPRFFLSLKNNIVKTDEYAEHIKECILKADIVVWDDVGTKGITEFENENMLSIVDTRLNNGRSNIFTSNISPIVLSDVIGQRLSSRILNFSEIIHFTGKDKRNLRYT